MFNHIPLACAVCFGDPASPLTKGLGFGMLSLFVVVVTVLSFFVRFFRRFAKRSRRNAQLLS